MGDEVEAAIYNDGGKSAPQKLKSYVNEQMNRILNDKMNERNFKLKSKDLMGGDPCKSSNLKKKANSLPKKDSPSKS